MVAQQSWMLTHINPGELFCLDGGETKGVVQGQGNPRMDKFLSRCCYASTPSRDKLLINMVSGLDGTMTSRLIQ